jgi:Lipase (class 3)
MVSGRFLNGYMQVNTVIVNAVRTAAQQNFGFKVVTIGHSYGGAIANLAAVDLRRLANPSLQVDLVNITFACTRSECQHHI